MWEQEFINIMWSRGVKGDEINKIIFGETKGIGGDWSQRRDKEG